MKVTRPPKPKRQIRLQPFGKYVLLDRVSVGGMAEVFRASERQGEHGLGRLVAIKCILPTLVEDQEFIEMFIDEAKIAGRLTHPNIGRIYELGKVGSTYYIAMEYIWGKDLLQIINRFRRLRKHMPPEMVAWVGAKMCQALHYAHNKRGADGEPLNIVHRDISPQNAIINYEGKVKLIDFGIAKAASRNTRTRAGVLKGKFGYMSPEQVRGDAIDQRSDLFALGTCLHEMSTSERLFLGKSDFSTLEHVRNVDVIPPSAKVQGIPKPLERIILKALTGDPALRWQSALEMGEEFHQFLKTQNPYGTSRMAEWMKAAFSKEIAEEEKQLEDLLRRAENLLKNPLPPVTKQREPTAKTKQLTAPEPKGRSRDSATALDTQTPEARQQDTLDSLEMVDSTSSGIHEEATVITADPEHEQQVLGRIADSPTQVFFSAEEVESDSVVAEESSNQSPQRMWAELGSEPSSPRAPDSAVGQSVTSPVGDGSASRPAVHQSKVSTGPWKMDGVSRRPAGLASINISSARGLYVSPAMLITIITLVFALLGGGALLWYVYGRPTRLEIRTNPPVAAEVIVDGKLVGQAPISLQGLSAGQHTVQVRYRGFDAETRTVDLESGYATRLEIMLNSDAAQKYLR